MNNLESNVELDSSSKKRPSRFALGGFLLLIFLTAWLSVQLLQVFPSAFSSLASLANNLKQHQEEIVDEDKDPEFVLTANKTIAGAGEEVHLVWSNLDTPGTYSISYQCINNAEMELSEGNENRKLTCNNNYTVGSSTTATVAFYTKNERYTDLNYSISFLGNNDTSARVTASSSITIINGDVSEESAEEIVTNTESVATDEPKVETSVVPSTPVAPSPEYTIDITYVTPVSDPNGYIDLGVRFLDMVNTILLSNSENFSEDDKAVQIEVKNHGTKTSDNWTYSINLPDGSSYTSPFQEPLLPNEHVILTININLSNAPHDHVFTVSVDEDNDQNISNDSFEHAVIF